MKSNFINTHREVSDITAAGLRFVGMWTIDPNRSTLTKMFYSIYNKLMLILVCIFAATVLVDLFESYSDLLIATDDGCFLAGIAVVIFKLFVFQLRRRRIQQLIERVHNPVDLLSCSSDQGVLKVIRACILWEKTILIFLSTLAASLILAMIFLVPTEKGELPIRARYPFPTTEPPLHNVAFFLQASAVSVGLVSITMMDNMVLGLCWWLRMQLIVLASNYENCTVADSQRGLVNICSDLPDDKSRRATGIGFVESKNMDSEEIRCFIPFELAEAEVANYEAADCFVTRFKICVKHHQRLISIAEEMNALFNSSMFIQLLASFSMICLTGFQAVLGARESASLMKFTLYLGAAFSQLLHWCFCGNELTYQSASLAKSQWFSGWEKELTAEVACLVTFSLIRTRKVLELKAGKFYAMSMETFIAILRASYSFFALLSSATIDNDFDAPRLTLMDETEAD